MQNNSDEVANQKTHNFLKAVLFLVIAGILMVIGYVVVIANNDAETAQNQAQELSKNEKVAASASPVATEPNLTAETRAWLKVTSAQKAFTVRIPDGWKGSSHGKSDNLRFGALTYTPGTKAEIDERDYAYGGDGIAALAITVYPKGTSYQTPTVESVPFQLGTVTGKKYMEVLTEDDLNYTSQSVGDKTYTYQFALEGGRQLNVAYYLKVGETDQMDLVEKVIKTIALKE